MASSLQPKTTFPKISERTLWTLLGAAGGLLAARPGGVGARRSRLDSVRDTRPPEPIAARSRCASGRYLCPQTVTARRGGVCGAGISAGAARERRSKRSGGRTGSIRAPETGRSDRRARIRAAHGHIIYIPGVAAGAGEAVEGGQWVDMRGVCPGLVHPERRSDTLRCS